MELTESEYAHFMELILPPRWALLSFPGLIDPLGPHNEANTRIRYQLIKHSGERLATFIG